MRYLPLFSLQSNRYVLRATIVFILRRKTTHNSEDATLSFSASEKRKPLLGTFPWSNHLSNALFLFSLDNELLCRCFEQSEENRTPAERSLGRQPFMQLKIEFQRSLALYAHLLR